MEGETGRDQVGAQGRRMGEGETGRKSRMNEGREDGFDEDRPVVKTKDESGV